MTQKETVSLAEARKDIQYMQGEMHELKEAVKNLPDELIKKLDDRYAKKQELEEIKETVAPITKFRKRLWQYLVFGVFTIALVAIIMWEIERFKAS